MSSTTHHSASNHVPTSVAVCREDGRYVIPPLAFPREDKELNLPFLQKSQAWWPAIDDLHHQNQKDLKADDHVEAARRLVVAKQAKQRLIQLGKDALCVTILNGFVAVGYGDESHLKKVDKQQSIIDLIDIGGQKPTPLILAIATKKIKLE